MNLKTYISLFVTIVYSSYLFGQDYNKYCLYSDYAVKAYENGKYEQAISLMDSAISECKEQNNDVANWYNLSLFYKTLYKKNKDRSLRKNMLSSILYAQGLDHENQYEKPINSFIKTVANYYYKDAITIMDDTSSNFSGAVENYNEYKAILKLTDSSLDFKELNIDFYNVFAGRNNMKFENNKAKYANYADSAILYYKKSLLLDSNQAQANNSLGSIYFNQAVEIIKNLDPEVDFEVAMQADNKKADLALKGLPYFKRAFKLSPENSNIIYALSGCYDILNFNDKKDFYLAILKEKDLEYYNSVMGLN